MKTNLLLSCALFAALATAGCDRSHDHDRDLALNSRDPRPASAQPTTPAAPTAAVPASAAPTTAVPSTAVGNPTPAAEPLARVVTQLKDLSYDSRDQLSTVSSSIDAQVDAQLAAWQAAGRTLDSGAIAKLDGARAAAKAKIDALSMATAETWNTARDDAVAALGTVRDTLQAAGAGAGNH